MQKVDIKSFAVVMGKLYATFDRESSVIQIEQYYEALCDLTIEQLEHAARKWIATGRFFPKPVELREIAKPDTTDYDAGQAWMMAVSYVTDSPYAITFSDPLINAVIRRLGGRATFSRIGSNELERFWRPRFLEEYKRLRAMDCLPRHMVDPLPSLLSGYITNHRGPRLIECDYVTHKPAIEHRPDNEDTRLIFALSQQKSIN